MNHFFLRQRQARREGHQAETDKTHRGRSIKIQEASWGPPPKESSVSTADINFLTA
ncbi:unnamed protein product [Brassica oleracea var. botrytis]|uniref:(rape) hypothetical protein n=1 Tax=Brassica napus TaxID=3708 RepID=A0A816IU03_BRANA|nr:unnamed protein product [Brassica napus]